MDEVRVLGYCAECGNKIVDEEDCYVNSDGEYFCSVECVMENYNIVKVDA